MTEMRSVKVGCTAVCGAVVVIGIGWLAGPAAAPALIPARSQAALIQQGGKLTFRGASNIESGGGDGSISPAASSATALLCPPMAAWR